MAAAEQSTHREVQGGAVAAATTSNLVAAVDLGSNSFHLIVAQLDDGEIAVVDRLRETVRLGAGLDDAKDLTAEAQERALACLERFGQRLRNLKRGNVRIVGTNTLRRARNATVFVRAARQALGHPIDIIAGREEARLIYLGVAHGLEARDESRLVVDIGGGSTEIITGQGFDISHRESLHIGCVSLSRKFFPEGKIKRKRLGAAELEAELAIQPVMRMFKRAGWERAIGCSGTAKAIRSIVQAEGWCERGITREALANLRETVSAAGHVDKLTLAGLADDRRPVLMGGLVILWAVFDLLGIDRMDVSDQALREGVLYDLIGRIHHTDVRDRSVQAMVRRWSVDNDHAERVTQTALELLGQVAAAWELEGAEDEDMLGWAARLHEIGLSIAHGQYHKHGAYVIGNADLSGFSRHDQSVLAVLIRGHRRKFAKALFANLPEDETERVRRLCIVLRLAALLHRGRDDNALPALQLSASESRIRLTFPLAWLDQHPLTRADLEQEAEYLASGGFRLEFS